MSKEPFHTEDEQSENPKDFFQGEDAHIETTDDKIKRSNREANSFFIFK